MLNKEPIDLIKKFEGCVLQAYLCPANKLTIGYGHTEGVKTGATITQQEADALLMSDLARFETAVDNMVLVRITENQRGALIAFAFNIGKVALKNSTLLQCVNTKDFLHAADEFLKWDKATIHGVKKPLAGLTARRKAERELFLTP